MPNQFSIGAVFATAIAIVSYYVRFLTASGSVATFVLASLIYGLGGWKWTIPILIFFVSSSLLSKFGKKRKAQFENVFEKSSTRDYAQVAANGGVAGMLVTLSYFFPSFNFYSICLGSIAAVTADTWGTEIGVLAKGKSISITTLRQVAAGISGGVSFEGFIGGTVGAAMIALSGFQWIRDLRIGIWIVFAGIVGSLVDSLLGSTLQAQYRCAVCGRTTERAAHCNQPAELVHGFRWVNNDLVNWVCASTGAITMMLAHT